jgi:hypothetical protein
MLDSSLYSEEFRNLLHDYINGKAIEIRLCTNPPDYWMDFPAYSNRTCTGIVQRIIEGASFRLKRKQELTIPERKIPMPSKVGLMQGTTYFTPALHVPFFTKNSWAGSFKDTESLCLGLVYLNQDDAIKAAKAMIPSPDKVQ